MAPNPTIMKAVEQLDYRTTIGDLAAHVGMDVRLAERELLALASEAGGHLQVAQSGDIVYQFPQNFRAVLRQKFFRLQLQQWWEKIWRILFYLIRISFGIILIVSIVLIFVTIFIILSSLNRDGDNRSSGNSRSGGGIFFMPHFWWGPDLFWFFDPNYRSYQQRRQQRVSSGDRDEMNFFEAVFSFLFGDGNPNANLEERRWQEIAATIRNARGAVVAEQIAPYLDDLGADYDRENEDYMLPVLTRFNGRPEVSPDGQIVYHFPELQVRASRTQNRSTSDFLQEFRWQFSHASSGQIVLASGLGGVNIVGALMLGYLLRGGAIASTLGGLVAFVASIYWLLLGYGVAFLGVPLIRYFWIQWRNEKIERRNQERQSRAIALNQASPELHKKLNYAEKFAAETTIDSQDLAYTTETDLVEQEVAQTDRLDAEWRRRLEGE
jgi:hypothetical protein